MNMPYTEEGWRGVVGVVQGTNCGFYVWPIELIDRADKR
jgi:hypothetical protein